MKRVAIAFLGGCWLLAAPSAHAQHTHTVELQIHVSGENAGLITVNGTPPDRAKRDLDPTYRGEGVPPGMCGITWRGPQSVEEFHWADDGGSKDKNLPHSEMAGIDLSKEISFTGPYGEACGQGNYFFSIPLIIGGGPLPCGDDCAATTLVVYADALNIHYRFRGGQEIPFEPPEIPVPPKPDPCTFGGVDLCPDPEVPCDFLCLCKLRGLTEEACNATVLDNLSTFSETDAGLAVNEVFFARSELANPQPDFVVIRNRLHDAQLRLSLTQSALGTYRSTLSAAPASASLGSFERSIWQRASTSLTSSSSLTSRCVDRVERSLRQLDEAPGAAQLGETLRETQRICDLARSTLGQLRSAASILAERGLIPGLAPAPTAPRLYFELSGGRLYPDEAGLDDLSTFGARIGWQPDGPFGLELGLAFADGDRHDRVSDLTLIDLSFLVRLPIGDRHALLFAGPGWVDVTSGLPGHADDRGVTAHVGVAYPWALGDHFYLRPDVRVRRIETGLYTGTDLEGSLAIGWRF